MPSDLVDVEVAARLSSRVASAVPLDRSYLLDDFADSMAAVVAEAEPLVEEETGFRSPTKAIPRSLSRAEWAAANIGSTVTLLEPLLTKMDERLVRTPVSALVRRAYRPVLGIQIGTVLGILSHRVLGQYDVVGSQEEVWFVAPNMVLMEKRHGFSPRDFRMWVALHELTHRAQFSAHPWLRDHFLDLVEKLFEGFRIDARTFLQRLIDLVQSGEAGSPLGLLDPEQTKRFEALQAFMSVIEGHGNHVMDSIAERVVPTQPRMKRTLRARASMGGIDRIIRKLMGLELKRLQYEEGQEFFRRLEARGGREAVAGCFDSPDHLPSLAEVRDPSIWLERVAS